MKTWWPSGAILPPCAADKIQTDFEADLNLFLRPAAKEEKEELEEQLRNSEYWEEYVR